MMAKTSGSPFAASHSLIAIPVEAIWKYILLHKGRENVDERLQVRSLAVKSTKVGISLVMIMEMILNHQKPPSAVVDLGLITAKAMETHVKCAEAHSTSLGMRTSNVLDSSVRQ